MFPHISQLALLLAIVQRVRGDLGDEIITHNAAVEVLNSDGATVCSRGRCSDRNNPNCTSLDQIRARCVFLVRDIRTSSRCRIVVVGGTEAGHQPGTYSHWNGWKIDIADNDCLTSYITSRIPRIRDRISGERRYLFYRRFLLTKKSDYWCLYCAEFPRP